MREILNLPWTITGVLLAILSIPLKVRTHRKPFAIIFTVKSFWWQTWMKNRKGIRACTVGNIAMEGLNLLPHDLEHELIHIEQAQRQPFIYPLLYAYQSLRYGYRENKYEKEAYDKSGSVYLEK